MIPKLSEAKKAQITAPMVGLALGIIIVAVVAVLGSVVLSSFASSQATCPATLPVSGTLNLSTGYCCNATYCSTTDGGGTASVSAYYAAVRMGSTNSGLLTWLPVIIPAVIGFAIIAMFLRMRMGGEGTGY